MLECFKPVLFLFNTNKGIPMIFSLKDRSKADQFPVIKIRIFAGFSVLKNIAT